RAAAAVKGDLRRITLSHVEDVIALMETGPPNGRLALPEGVRVAREGEILRIVTSGRGERARRGSPDRGLPGSVRAREQEVRRPGAAPVLVEMEEMGMALRFSSPPLFSAPDLAGAGEKTGFFDLDALCFPLVIREVRPGDRFCPMGMTGSKKVKKYFIDRKIPGARRGDYPLLLSGDEIVWVIGLRQNESSRVTPATRNLLKVELFLA
ncbi:MAG: tRNA lysidine(34) synthetase TilS, partial [Desulfobacterales bacterium]|nr:tRNA lysidine(34) synthetase TilS [Desulfobacterales bacterium]